MVDRRLWWQLVDVGASEWRPRAWTARTPLTTTIDFSLGQVDSTAPLEQRRGPTARGWGVDACALARDGGRSSSARGLQPASARRIKCASIRSTIERRFFKTPGHSLAAVISGRTV